MSINFLCNGDYADMLLLTLSNWFWMIKTLIVGNEIILDVFFCLLTDLLKWNVLTGTLMEGKNKSILWKCCFFLHNHIFYRFSKIHGNWIQLNNNHQWSNLVVVIDKWSFKTSVQNVLKKVNIFNMYKQAYDRAVMTHFKWDEWINKHMNECILKTR